MAQVKELICIGCPMGCMLSAQMEGNEVTTVTGNTCPRGDAYARKELTSPTRIVTSIAQVEGGELPVVSVKTESDIPKSKIMDCMEAIKNTTVAAPITIGDVIVKNVAATGVNVVATKNVKKVSEHE